MGDIKILRQQIDDIDKQLLRLLNERAQLSIQIGTLKNTEGHAIYDDGREMQILNRLQMLNKGPLENSDVVSVFQSIMQGSRKLQENLSSKKRASNPFPFQTVGIFGWGVMGASLGKALLNFDANIKIKAFDPNLRLHHSSILACETADDLLHCDLIVLAAPISANIEFLKKQGEKIASETLVIDFGSTKASTLNAYNSLSKKSFSFVGGHPLAGSPESGAPFSDPYLFKEKYFILVSENEAAIDLAQTVVEAVQAKPITLNAEDHDHILALSSHWPHLLALALSGVAEKNHLLDRPQLFPKSFRQFLKLAASNEDIWVDIFCDNSSEILSLATELEQQIRTLTEAIKNQDRHYLLKTFALSKYLNNRLGEKDDDHRTKEKDRTKTVA